MKKTRSFSIFLLKAGFDATNSLQEDHPLEVEADASALPTGASLFILDAMPAQPWWKGYFGIQRELSQVSKGALLILPAGGRMFAVTFGHVAHNLKDESYEYDFGLRVTLNCVDPLQLKNTDVLEPGAARRQRTQVAVASDLTYFDFDQDSTVLKSLTGKAKAEYRETLSQATGASNLRVSTRVAAHELAGLCAKLLELYARDDYLITFPNIHNVSPVSDPAVLTDLNARLLDALRTKSTDLYLAVPTLVDYQEGLYVTFSGAGESAVYNDVFLTRYYEYLASHNRALSGIDLDSLKRHKLNVTNEDGQPRRSFSIYKSLIFDTAIQATGSTYHFADGNWYRVASSYVELLREYLDPRCQTLSLPPYNHPREDDYNAAVAAVDSALLCLDKTDISISGQTMVEPCDLYAIGDNAAVFYHVKVSTFSADLSHLFNQGTNAVELLRLEAKACENLRVLIEEKAGVGSAPFLSALSTQRYEVTFAIVTHKDSANKSANLPLFSRITLMRILRHLHLIGVPARFGFIRDDRPSIEGKKKPRQKKKPGATVQA